MSFLSEWHVAPTYEVRMKEEGARLIADDPLHVTRGPSIPSDVAATLNCRDLPS